MAPAFFRLSPVFSFIRRLFRSISVVSPQLSPAQNRADAKKPDFDQVAPFPSKSLSDLCGMDSQMMMFPLSTIVRTARFTRPTTSIVRVLIAVISM